MENLAYTAKERAAITDAFSAIRHACECWDWTAPGQLRDALSLAREGGVRPITEAKAHTVNAVLKGLTRGSDITAAELYGFARAYTLAVILGAGYASRRDRVADAAELTARLEAAGAAHEAALGRFLALIRDPSTRTA